MHARHLRDLIIDPVLMRLEMHSEAAVRLLLMTAAHESHMGDYLAQYPSGPAMGIYQMEPIRLHDVVYRYLPMRGHTAEKLSEVATRLYPGDVVWQSVERGVLRNEIVGNLRFATAVARIAYFMDPEPLPDPDDEIALYRYYKRVWNTTAGKATQEKVLADYHRLVVEPGTFMH